jgi:ribonuclease P protein component
VLRYKLGKHEILRGSAFQEVFEQGKKLDGNVLRCIIVLTKELQKKTQQQIQMGFAVRSTIVRRAVDRNRVRRLMREAYRLNKHTLSNLRQADCRARIIFLFSPNEKEFVIPTYKEVEQDVKLFLSKIDTMLMS